MEETTDCVKGTNWIFYVSKEKDVHAFDCDNMVRITERILHCCTLKMKPRLEKIYVVLLSKT